MLGFWLLVVLLFLFLAALPAYSYSLRWGYYPSIAAVAGLLVVMLLIWIGYLAFAWPWDVAVPR